jgi:(1->4)-alpha-D-glucan 1-alpha-D-glucosylmutase
VRVEDPDVFDATHAFIGSLMRQGAVTGLRVDHPDGLALPAEYLARLAAFASRAAGNAVYVLVEKILAREEELPRDWAAHGTTGYDFLNALNGIFVDRSRSNDLAHTYARFAGRRQPFAEVAEAAKRVVLETAFGGDLDRLTRWSMELASHDRRHRDLTARLIRRALVELIVSMPVYRTYVGRKGASATDRARLAAAVAGARRRRPDLDPAALAFLSDLFLEPRPDAAVLRVVLRAQQLMAAVFAKSIEDTAFYRDNTLVSLNEVGGDPARGGAALAKFHRFIRARTAAWPLAMNATATHDTKLGEDSRARLNALSELSGDWRRAIGQWRRMNAARRSRAGDITAPDRHEEYRFYQGAIAIWPPGPVDSAAPTRAIVDRLLAYMIKSVREARRHTTWTSPNDAYEIAIAHFVRASLADAEFVRSLSAFARRIARIGAVNSLSQTLVKIAAPGVPDFYQGCERWNLQLVDPDNRQRPDFAAAARALARVDAIAGRADNGRRQGLKDLLHDWHSGDIKLFVTARALRFRRAQADLFLAGEYVPLDFERSRGAAGIVAFARRFKGRTVIGVATRLASGVMDAGAWPIGDAWGSSSLVLPAGLRGRRFHDVVSGETIDSDRGRVRLPLREVLAHLPVALLENDPAG